MSEKKTVLAEVGASTLRPGDIVLRGADAAARHTGYSSSWIFQETMKRHIPHFKRGRKLFFIQRELDEWLTAKRVMTIEQLNAEAEKRLG
ncbi:MAG: hypothetical protein ABII93_05705 [Chrysiogenia bacterium]